MDADKLRFEVLLVEGGFRASCVQPPITAQGTRLVSLRANVAAAIGAALGEPRPFVLMVGAPRRPERE
jgi:hypothetical protein